MKLRAGQKLHSTVSEAQVVVVKAPDADVEVACGGVPMVEEAPADAAGADGEGPQLGKRYADDELGLELLCSRAGAGALTVDGRELPLKGAKPLPSSD
ncbi:MAG TPA: hypothetical protein VJ804_08510 [Acidimicrobiales bacterium]|nr:hypothetical protein [Acidimicrobiales bacterium]